MTGAHFDTDDDFEDHLFEGSGQRAFLEVDGHVTLLDSAVTSCGQFKRRDIGEAQIEAVAKQTQGGDALTK